MDHPCPENWQYEQHARRGKLLKRAVENLLIRLSRKAMNALDTARDSRAAHGELFRDLAPPHFTYFAGHYRGEPFRCLKHYAVGVHGDSRVGVDPEHVQLRMTELSQSVSQGIVSVDAVMASAATPDAKLLRVVELACYIFDFFLQIHPYANGNGHAARFVVWCVLGHYGFWPVRWTVEPRPPDPPYTALLLQHRAGDRRPLVEHVLNCIK